MVNTGKPSKGCYMCRARRIKCDEGKPSCMRCQKSKRICPGYRDAFELKLRDETKSTKKKMSRIINHRPFIDGAKQFGNIPEFDESRDYCASQDGVLTLPITTSNLNTHDTFMSDWKFRRGHNSKGSISSISSLSSLSSSTSPISVSSQPRRQMMTYHTGCILANLSIPIDQQATCFFLSNFVILPKQGVLRGYLDFLIPFLKTANQNDSLQAAFSAVALAALGTRPHSKALLPQAEASYYKALKKINSTLRDPDLASNDTTLAAVLLLSYFEQLTAPRRSQEGWSSHVDGAVALLKARGPDKFQTPQGREVWNTVRAMMVIQRIANSRPVDLGEDWWMSVPACDERSHRFAALNIRVANLRADNDTTTIQIPRTAENYERVIKLLRRAEQLENEYVEWFKSLTGNWAVKSVAWVDNLDGVDLENSLVHPGKVDSYSEMWMAYHHNIGRSSRLFIWTTIMRCVAWLCDSKDYKLTPEYATGTSICRQLIEDTVASVPFIFGWNKETNDAMVDKSSFACGQADTAVVKSLWGIFVMWPLFAAAASDFAIPSQRIFLRGRLQYISENLGVHLAKVLLRAPLLYPSFYIELEKRSIEVHNTNVEPVFVDESPNIPLALPAKKKTPEDPDWNPFSRDAMIILPEDMVFATNINDSNVIKIDRCAELNSYTTVAEGMDSWAS